jgi:hypothetical protein
MTVTAIDADRHESLLATKRNGVPLRPAVTTPPHPLTTATGSELDKQTLDATPRHV